jgi:peptidyl-prolyl cis-trans isomerase A (cyclophilin A)
MRRFLAGGPSVGAVICLAAAAAWAQTQSQSTTKKPTSTTHHAATHPAVHRSLLDPATLNQKAPETFKAKFTTTKGDFVVEVTRAWAPLGADRFYNLVKNGFFTDVEFFRMVPPFVVQFGISGTPKIAAVWTHANIQDDPVTKSNKSGYVTFATAGPNTRTTQVFINLGDNVQLDGQGFAPFGQVIEGMDVIGKFDSEYADQPTGAQGQIESQGNAFLKSSFPNLDSIKTAVIVPAAPVAKKPAAAATKKPGAVTTKKPAATQSN